MKKNSDNAINTAALKQKEERIIKELHDLMVGNQVFVTTKESNPEAGGTTIEVVQGNDKIIIPIIDNQESLRTNSF